MTKKYLCTLLLGAAAGLGFAQVDLSVSQEDVAVEFNSGRSIGTSTAGVNLYVRRASCWWRPRATRKGWKTTLPTAPRNTIP